MVSSRIFRSRWAALLWAGGIVWTAYDVATAMPADPPAAKRPDATVDATGTTVDPADLAIVANAGG